MAIRRWSNVEQTAIPEAGPSPFLRLYETERTRIIVDEDYLFRKYIIPMIPADLIQLLYSTSNAVRPAEFAINKFAALLYIKVFSYPEAMFLKRIHSDLSMQYALGTEYCEKQPFSHNSLQRLRNRIRKYLEETGVDLLESITSHIDLEIAKKMNLSDSKYNDTYDKAFRIDSLMVDCRGQALSRIGIVYCTTALAVGSINLALGENAIPDNLKHYLEKEDKNRKLYYKGTIPEVSAELKTFCSQGQNSSSNSQSGEATIESSHSPVNENSSGSATNVDNAISSSPLESTSDHAEPDNFNSSSSDISLEPVENTQKGRCEVIGHVRLYNLFQELLQVKDLLVSYNLTSLDCYSLVTRVISEQSYLDENGTRILRDKHDIQGSSLQSVTDPDATYRSKNNEGYHGWIGAFAELYDNEGHGVIVFRSLQPNIYSDQSFAIDFLSTLDGKEKIALSADALFATYDINQQAEKKNVTIYCGTSTGVSPNPALADFKINEDGSGIQNCPAGNAPDKCSYHDRDNSFTLSFSSGCCKDCTLCGTCKATLNKRGSSTVKVTEKQILTAQNFKNLKDPNFLSFVNKRNGVEGIPSVLRRKYRVDENPNFGIVNARMNYYICITAYNINKLFRYLADKRKNEKKAAISA